MFRRSSLAFGVLSAVAALSLTTGCGGGAPGSGSWENIPHPLVRQFSPTMSPIDFNTLQANPTFTDGMLTVSTDPRYPGEIVIFFQEGEPFQDINGNSAFDPNGLDPDGIGPLPTSPSEPYTDANGNGHYDYGTRIDPDSLFVGGNPSLGIDLNSVQILQFIPGTGNVPLVPAPNGVIIGDSVIRFRPAALPLADGQYAIGVFGNLKSVEGNPVDKTPVFHSFTVGAADTIPPEVVVTNPPNGAVGIGAGVAPPPPPTNVPSSSIADVRTTIFGPVSPDVVIRFNEAVDAATITPNTILVTDAGSIFIPPPAIAPAPGFPKLKSQVDGSSLPSNGFEVVWRADPVAGAFPFGTQIGVKVVGFDGGTNSAPVRDRSTNMLQASYSFQFQTIAPPALPVNPEPEYAIYWAASDRFGVIDGPNQEQIAGTFLGTYTNPIVRNVLPVNTDTIATKKNLGVTFDPFEISVDARTDGLSCHTFCYLQSKQSGQIVIINSRTSLPVALINTPSPGGLSNQTGGGQAANVLLATNASANTFTVFNIANITPGRQFLNGPIFISQVSPTGNTPTAITISAPATGAYNREFVYGGPGIPLIMYANFTDGVVNTANLSVDEPKKQFALGVGASPNDISMTPCFNPLNPILFAAISEGGAPGDGKVAYYITGPGCQTGISTGGRPDSLVGDLSGFEAPAGLDNIFPFSPNAFFALAESGANQIRTLGIQTGAINLPQIVLTVATAANPVAIAHKSSWYDPLTGGFMCQLFTPGCPILPVAFLPAPCWYFGTEQIPATPDGTGNTSLDLYVCARGASRVQVFDLVGGSQDFYSPIIVPGIRSISAPGSQ